MLFDYKEEILNNYIKNNCNDSLNYEDFLKNIKITEEIFNEFRKNNKKTIMKLLFKEIKKYDKKKCPFYSILNTKNQRIMKIKINNIWNTYYYDESILTKPIINKIKIWLFKKNKNFIIGKF
jgi:hypothetical protein